MKIVLENKYRDILFDDTTRILTAAWKRGNIDITEPEIRELVQGNADMVRQYKPLLYVAYDVFREFPIMIDLQKWVAQVMLESCMEVGLQKFAMVLPKDFIAELSTEQTVEEAGKLPFELQYFRTEAEAMAWILA